MRPTNHRDRAILWSRDRLKKPFVTLDTETTGLDHRAEVCQVGIVNCRGKVLLDCLVRPTRPIPPEATRIHGIADADLDGAFTFLDIEPLIMQICTGYQVLIYNADYDARILNQSIMAYGQQPIKLDTYCVMEAYSEFIGDWSGYHGNYRWHKLTDAARHFNIDTTGAHGAVTDALMTLGVLRGMDNKKLSSEATQ